MKFANMGLNLGHDRYVIGDLSKALKDLLVPVLDICKWMFCTHTPWPGHLLYCNYFQAVKFFQCSENIGYNSEKLGRRYSVANYLCTDSNAKKYRICT